MAKERKKITEGRIVMLAYYEQEEMRVDGRRMERWWRAEVRGRAQTGRNSREIKEEE